MPPKRSAPSRGSQSVQNSGSKPPLPEKVVNEAPAKQMVATTFVPLAPVIPLGSPFENHLNHAKKLYKDKATMIVNVQKKRVIAAKRLKKLQLANIEAQFNFEMTQAVSQSEVQNKTKQHVFPCFLFSFLLCSISISNIVFVL